MAGLRLGTVTPTSLRLGTATVIAAYLGTTQVYTTGSGVFGSISGVANQATAAIDGTYTAPAGFTGVITASSNQATAAINGTVTSASAPIGYRTFNGSSDALTVNIGNLASANSVPETWVFAGRLLSVATADGEIVHSNGYDPLDFYMSHSGGKYQFYDGASDANDGPTTSATLDVIVAFRRGTSTAARWSISTHNGTVWSSFTHTNSATTFSNRSYPSSGVLEFAQNAALNARYALVARYNAALSDADVETLSSHQDAWSALASCTNLWRFDGTTVQDVVGTATQNTLTGTSVTSGAFPLDGPTGGGGGGGFTGTLIGTGGQATAAINGTFTAASGFTGTITASSNQATAAINGTYTAPTGFTGVITASSNRATASLAGTVGGSGFARYRIFTGTDHVDFTLGNLVGASSVPQTMVFVVRNVSNTGNDSELVASPGFDPLDIFYINGGTTVAIYDGATFANGPQFFSGSNWCLFAIRTPSGSAAIWSRSLYNGTSWPTPTHTNTGTTFSNRTYPSSGNLVFGGGR